MIFQILSNEKPSIYADDIIFLNFYSDWINLKSPDWFKENVFPLNDEKTQNILFTLRGTSGIATLYSYTKEVKLFGTVFLNIKMCHGVHI